MSCNIDVVFNDCYYYSILPGHGKSVLQRGQVSATLVCVDKTDEISQTFFSSFVTDARTSMLILIIPRRSRSNEVRGLYKLRNAGQFAPTCKL